MFTIEQIKSAHSKVKSGADFMAYIQELKILGVTFYETFVIDSHTDYFGTNDFKVSSPGKYVMLSIALTSKKNSLSQTLKPTNRAKQTTRPSAAIVQRQVSRNGLLTCTK
jgi:uncharacterized protein YbcV (DUF1398 family)